MSEILTYQQLKNNDVALMRYITQLSELALSRYEWKNLPPSVDPRALELYLLEHGNCLFFEDEVLGFLALPSLNTGNLSVYNIPNKRTAIAPNGYQKQLSENDSVLIFNNYLLTSTIPTILDFANRLWEYDRTIDVNIHAQKTPILLQCEQTQLLSVKNLYAKYDGNAPVIYTNKKFEETPIKVINTNAPFVADKVGKSRDELWKQALEFLGIKVASSKRERMTDDEIRNNAMICDSVLKSGLMSRQNAVRKINEMFSLNIEVVASGLTETTEEREE